MKTSFYFLVWFLIYPLLGLFHNSFIDQNAFLFALLIVWTLSLVINRAMPQITSYDLVCRIVPVMEDVYTGNVKSFKKRLLKDAWIKTIYAIYFWVTTVVIFLMKVNSSLGDWIGLFIFVYFAITSTSLCVKKIKSYMELKSNPTPEQCREIAEDAYGQNCAAYFDARERAGSYENLLAFPPKHFVLFQWVSIVIAALTALAGLIFITLGIVVLLVVYSFEGRAVASMYFLYGFLAAYFGVKDFISILQYFINKSRRKKAMMK